MAGQEQKLTYVVPAPYARIVCRGSGGRGKAAAGEVASQSSERVAISTWHRALDLCDACALRWRMVKLDNLVVHVLVNVDDGSLVT